MRLRYRITFSSGTVLETNQMRTITHAWMNRYHDAVRYGFSTSRDRAEASAQRNAAQFEHLLGPVVSTEITDRVTVVSPT